MKFLIWTSPLCFFAFGTLAQATDILTYQEALRMAREHNLEIQKAANALKLAKFERDALEKKDDPKLTASAGETAKYTHPDIPISATNRTWTSNEPISLDELYSLQASGSLIDFGRTAADRTKANLLIEEKASSVKEQEETIVIKVSRAYSKVLGAQDVANLAERQMQTATQKYTQVKESYDQGLRPEYDLVRAESDLGKARIAQKKSQDDLTLALLTLQLLVSDASSENANRASPTFRCKGTLHKSKAEWQKLKNAIAQSHSAAVYETRKLQRAGNNADLEAISAKIMPTLGATAGAMVSRSTPFPQTRSNDYRTTFSGGLILSWDIPWNLAYRDDKMRVALRDIDLQISEQTEHKTRSEKEQTAVVKIDSLIEQNTLLEMQVTVVSRNLKIVKQKYEAGKSSATELSVAEDEAITTETDAMRSQAATADALLDLAEANGNTNTELIFAKE